MTADVYRNRSGVARGLFDVHRRSVRSSTVHGPVLVPKGTHRARRTLPARPPLLSASLSPLGPASLRPDCDGRTL